LSYLIIQILLSRKLEGGAPRFKTALLFGRRFSGAKPWTESHFTCP